MADLAHLAYSNTLVPPSQVKPARGVFWNTRPFNAAITSRIARKRARQHKTGWICWTETWRCLAPIAPKSWSIGWTSPASRTTASRLSSCLEPPGVRRRPSILRPAGHPQHHQLCRVHGRRLFRSLWRISDCGLWPSPDRLAAQIGEAIKLGWFVPSWSDKLLSNVTTARSSLPIMCRAAALPAAIPPDGRPNPLAWFAGMIDHCYDFAQAAKAQGRPIVGIMCEFTPREIILAAGAVPVCLCGGSAATIPAGGTIPARQSLSAHQIHFRLSRHRQKSVFQLGGFGRRRDDLRRQKENVRVDGRHQTDVRARTAAEGR